MSCLLFTLTTYYFSVDSKYMQQNSLSNNICIQFNIKTKSSLINSCQSSPFNKPIIDKTWLVVQICTKCFVKEKCLKRKRFVYVCIEEDIQMYNSSYTLPLCTFTKWKEYLMFIFLKICDLLLYIVA